MHPRLKFRCERVRPNNGVVEVFLTNQDDPDEHVLLNIKTQHDQYKVGEHYWVEIQPAFPH